MTVFDPSTLARLVDDTDSRPFVLNLARTFQQLLVPRVGRLGRALVVGDLDEATDAVLSLRVSASMTGAHEIAELARLVESDIRRGDLAAARSHATLMPRAAQHLDAALSAYLAASA